jgi:hypothetical protein
MFMTDLVKAIQGLEGMSKEQLVALPRDNDGNVMLESYVSVQGIT